MKISGFIQTSSVLLIVGFFLSITILVSGCSESSQATNGTTRHISASWAEWYTNLASLKQHADIAIAGKIKEIADQTVKDNIPFTDFTFSISNTLYDPHHQLDGAGNNVIIHQTGGILNGQITEADDDPLFQVGEQAVLFLREYSPGHYFVIGGPSGRFRIQNGIVKPVTNQGIHLSGTTTEADFFSQIQKA